MDTCVELQQWSQAVSLAEQHQVEDIEGLLAQYAEYLLNKGDLSGAVELYKKAGRTLEAIKIMLNVRSCIISSLRIFKSFFKFLQLAKKAQEMNSPLIYIKKIYLLAAMLYDKFKETRKSNLTAAKKSSDLLMGIENPWRGVEAYHFLMLAQRQLYRGKHSLDSPETDNLNIFFYRVH